MDYVKMINHINFEDEFEELSLKEIQFLAKRMLHICNFTKLTPDQLSKLFRNMCIKDGKGKWRDLVYGTNYYVKIEYDHITIIPSQHLYFEGMKNPPSKFKDEYSINDPDIIFPQHSGWAKILNKNKNV